ncbi:hypothetical protein M231_06621 [Tremella mesenterica]|uniref:Uncharacterized protein n=1 Tax=Tremella mesenterica TaxID=5217 RepID=A0A4V1M399_TREME|nr:hypothetical protein M231_06621 [Tremella mesenterica]
MSKPIQTSRRPRKTRLDNTGIGGQVVSSVKRGIQKEDLHQRNRRLVVLLAVAFTGFVILTAFWISRLYVNIKSTGGVWELIRRLRIMLAEAGKTGGVLEHVVEEL